MAHLENRATLRAFGDPQVLRAFERGNFDFGSQSSLRERNGYDAMQVLTFALKHRVLFNVEHDVEIAGGTAVSSCFTLACIANARSIFDAGGHFDFEGALLSLPASKMER